jgi:hypothetical protein
VQDVPRLGKWLTITLSREIVQNQGLARKIVRMAEGENLEKTFLEFVSGPSSQARERRRSSPTFGFSRSGTDGLRMPSLIKR